jgi:hypothetical protein
MLRRKTLSGKMMSGNLLRRLLLELENLGELMMLRIRAEPGPTFPTARVYQFAPIAQSERRYARLASVKRSVRR